MADSKRLLLSAIALAKLAAANGLSSQALAQGVAHKDSSAASVVGIVIDSLHGRALDGAEILLTGPMNATRVTDVRGIFRFDSVPLGRYQLGAFHPLLDTLGVSLATEPFVVRTDSPSVVTFAIPSPFRFMQMKCGPTRAIAGSSAVIGRLTDATTSERISGAEILLHWTEYTVSKEKGVSALPHLLREFTDSSGKYSFCGLPNPIQARLEAHRDSAHTASVRVESTTETSGIIVRNLLLPTSGANGNSTLTGRVSDSDGHPLRYVDVQVIGTDAKARTGRDGEFSLGAVSAGTRALALRQVGYAAETVAVDLEAHRTKQVLVSLKSAVPVIDTVRVMAAQKMRQLDMVGFNDRRSRGDGQYITAEEIESRNPSRLTDILSGKRGIQIYNGVASNTRGLTTVVPSISIPKNYCIGFQVFVDAVPMPIPFNLDQISPRTIGGIEIYSGTATVPSLLRGGNTTCGVIALWTR
jgi:Carboxypeptidase regulatory-like domain